MKGVTSGGMIPQPAVPNPELVERVHSVLDRPSLSQLAQAGGGEYFEIGRGSDRDVAFALVSRLRQRAQKATVIESFEDLYWKFLLAAAIVLCVGTLLLRRRVELVWQATAAGAIVLLMVAIL